MSEAIERWLGRLFYAIITFGIAYVCSGQWILDNPIPPFTPDPVTDPVVQTGDTSVSH